MARAARQCRHKARRTGPSIGQGGKEQCSPLKMVQAAKSAGELIGRRSWQSSAVLFASAIAQDVGLRCDHGPNTVLFTTTIIETGAYLRHRLAKTKIQDEKSVATRDAAWRSRSGPADEATSHVHAR